MTEPSIRFEMIRWKEGSILSLNKFGHCIITENNLRFKQLPVPRIHLASSIFGLIAAVLAGHLLYSPLLVVGFVFGGRRVERALARRLNQNASSPTHQTTIIRPDDVLTTSYQSKFALSTSRGVLIVWTLHEQLRLYGFEDDLQELDTRLQTRTFVDETIYCPNCGDQIPSSEPACADCGKIIHD